LRQSGPGVLWYQGLYVYELKEESVVEKKYEVSMEIAGPAAMFTRPDTGAEVLV